jgi:hypothetical protein
MDGTNKHSALVARPQGGLLSWWTGNTFGGNGKMDFPNIDAGLARGS